MGALAMFRLRKLPTALLCLCATGAFAQNTMFLRESPIAHLDETDRKILRETIEQALESDDGTVIDWANPDSGSFGRVKVLDTEAVGEDKIPCRNIRARNESHGRKADGIYRLCEDGDGNWKFAAAGKSALNGEAD